MGATFYPPGRALRIMLACKWRRYQCGRRFRHFPITENTGRPLCGRCGAPLM